MFSIPKTEEDIDNIEDINIIDTMFGQTYLHILVQSQSSLLDYFLDKNPNPNIQNNDGKTPIFYAKDTPTIKKLISHGASIAIKDLDGNTPGQVNSLAMSNFIQSYATKFR